MKINFLKLSLILFIISLLGPALVYKPDVSHNPKNARCSMALMPGFVCSHFSYEEEEKASYSCGTREYHKGEVEDLEKIKKFCRGHDEAFPYELKGYEAFLRGPFAIIILNFAWYANPLALLLLVFARRKKYYWISRFTPFTILLALHAFAIEKIARDASGGNYNYVDYLGWGYYSWLLSLICLSIYVLQKSDSK